MNDKYLSSVYKRQGIGTALLAIFFLLALLSASCGSKKERPPVVIKRMEVLANGVIKYSAIYGEDSFDTYTKHAYYQIGDTIQ